MKKKNISKNLLIIAASEQDANLYYATHFIAPDSFVFFHIRDKSILLMSDLEVDRARKQSTVDEVISTSKLSREYLEEHGKRATFIELLTDFMKKRGALEFLVPANFPIEYADLFRKQGISLTVKPDPFFENRVVKTAEEIRHIEKAIRFVEIAVKQAIDALRKSVPRRGKLYLHGEVFTSEALKKIINVSLMENECIASHSIVACGEQAVDPHDEGSGPLYADQSIIMDIFPRHSQSRYFADFTRTVVRGKPSKKLQQMYDAVYEGQEIAFRSVRNGADGSVIHQAIHKMFEAQGFKTGLTNGRMQGFFHGTGHGLGLEIHEQPRISLGKDILKTGHVVTVEPGLYYQGIGGIRLEDVVVVTPTGCRNLTRFPKFLQIK